MTVRREKLVLLTPLRSNSERFPQKMLEKISGRTLAEIALSKIVEASAAFGCSALAAICPSDTALAQTASKLGVDVFERTERSRDGETAEDIYAGWDRALRDFDWMIWPNSCMPFLSLETISKAIRAIEAAEGPVASVFKHRGSVWDQSGRQVVGSSGLSNTKTDAVFFTLAHAFWCVPIERLGRPDMHAFTDFVELDWSPEFLDVHTPDDLRIARIWQAGLTADNHHQ